MEDSHLVFHKWSKTKSKSLKLLTKRNKLKSMTLEENYQRENSVKLSNSTRNPSEEVEEDCTASMEPLQQLNSLITQ